VVPINHHLVGPEIAYILADSEAKAFITHERFAEVSIEAAELAAVPLPGASPSVRSRVSAHTARGSPTSRRPRPGTARLAMS